MAFRRPDKKAGQQGVQLPDGRHVDEEGVAEWVDFGLSEMKAYLKNHARFADYCDKHPTQPDEPNPLD